MMLSLTKHAHPDKTLLSISLTLLSSIKRDRLVDYGKLKAIAKKSVAGGEFLFLPALNFLFLLGLIEYRSKIDAVEYIGSREAI